MIMPQWDFLNFIASESQKYPTHQLRMRTEVTGLIEEGERSSARAGRGSGGPAGGSRFSRGRRERKTIRVASAGRAHGPGDRRSMDVFWFRLSRLPEDRTQPAGRFDQGRILILIPREGTGRWAA